MVMKLDVPTVVLDEIRFVEEVVQQRTREPNKTYFENFENEWKDRVREYLLYEGNPELVSESTVVPDKTKFINLYKTDDDDFVQKPIIDKLRSRKLKLCPSCGEDGTPNTLDHYLPKDKYPEFSILSKNLFPMCDICQGKKLAKDKDEHGRRYFLHPYYDQFLSEQILYLSISGPFCSPKIYSISVTTEIDDDLREVIKRHIKGIDFMDRFGSYFRDQYFRLLRLVEFIRKEGNDVRSQMLAFHQMAKLKGVNSWEHVFYDGVLENDALMNFLVDGDFPDHR